MDKPHKKLDAWKLSMVLVGQVYEVTASFPEEERFGLTSQMRRSAISIPCNLAEGFARRNDKEIVQFIHVAMGSASELDTQIEICKRLAIGNLGCLEEADKLLTRVDKTLVGLRNHLQNKSALPKVKPK